MAGFSPVMYVLLAAPKTSWSGSPTMTELAQTPRYLAAPTETHQRIADLSSSGGRRYTWITRNTDMHSVRTLRVCNARFNIARTTLLFTNISLNLLMVGARI